MSKWISTKNTGTKHLPLICGRCGSLHSGAGLPPDLNAFITMFSLEEEASKKRRAIIIKLEGAGLAAIKLEAEFYKEIKLKELYPRMIVKGKEKFDDRWTYVLDATSAALVSS